MFYLKYSILVVQDIPGFWYFGKTRAYHGSLAALVSPELNFLKRIVSNLPASLFWIVWSWTLSHPPWDSHLQKACFPIYVHTPGSLFRHAIFKICREGLSYFPPVGFLKHSRNTCKIITITWEDLHIKKEKQFYLNNRVTLEGEQLILPDP